MNTERYTLDDAARVCATILEAMLGLHPNDGFDLVVEGLIELQEAENEHQDEDGIECLLNIGAITCSVAKGDVGECQINPPRS